MKETKMKKYVAGLSTKELVKLVFIDPVSGIQNRRAFDFASYEFVAIIDMDSLKWVNDNLGHLVGDTLLHNLGGSLATAFGENAYHLSGDEFAVVGNNLDDIFSGLYELRKEHNSFSFGAGRDLASADRDMQFDKKNREISGDRAHRGEAPIEMRVKSAKNG